jgi:hypothetical protein
VVDALVDKVPEVMVKRAEEGRTTLSRKCAIKGRDTTLKSFQVPEFACWDGSPEFIQSLVIDSVVGIRGKFARYLGPDFGFHLA